MVEMVHSVKGLLLAGRDDLWLNADMSLEALKREAAALPPDQLRHLMGYLVTLNTSLEERAELGRKMDDKDPSHWVTLEQLDAKLKDLDVSEKE